MVHQNFYSNNYLKTLKVIFAAMLGGQISFLGVSIFFIYTGALGLGSVSLREIFNFLVPISTLLGVAAGHLFFRGRLTQIKLKNSLIEKLNAYRTALIISFALLEAPYILAVVAYLLTASYLFFTIAILIIAVFFFLFPSKNKIINDLELNPTESKDLETINAPL
jgi:hypothetical protein